VTSRLARRSLLLGVPTLLLVVGAWVGWQAYQLNQDLRAAVDDATLLEHALRSGDQPRAESALDSLRGHAGAAADRTGGVTWSGVSRLPSFGDDARGLRLVSQVLSDLASDGLTPLVEDVADLHALVPVHGRVQIERLTALQQPVGDAHASFADADRRLAAEDPGDFLWVLEDSYVELADRVAKAERLLSTADTALRVLPTMLGRDRPRSYLLVFQNNAEVRATGGVPGAISLVTADDGRLRITDQVTAASLGETERPVLRLTAAEKALYGPQLGTYMLDAGFTPDVPRAAALMRARWEQSFDPVDGVVMVDPVAMSYVLGATGPVKVGDFELTEGNAVRALLHQVYVGLTDTAVQDEYFKLTSRTVFDRMVDGAADPHLLLEALARGASEHRLLVHSFDPAEQDLLDGAVVAGEHTAADATGPQVGIYLNDSTGAKMSYFLRTEVRVDATSCRDGVQRVTGTATFRSEAPKDAVRSLPAYVTGGGDYGIDPGSQLVAMRIYGPVGGTIDTLTLGGEDLGKVRTVDHDGRPVATVYPILGPQQTEEVGWTMTSGADQDGDVVVSVTPGVEPTDASSTAPTAC
jgi:hypothetical protein